MPALASTTRLLVLAGSSFPSQNLKLLPVRLSTWRCSVRFFSRVVREHQGPLTLASLGFSNQLDADSNGKDSKFEKNARLTTSRAVNPKSRVKPVVKARASIDGVELDAGAGSDGMSREVENNVGSTRSQADNPKSRVEPVVKSRASIDGIELDAAGAAGSVGMSREVENNVRSTMSRADNPKSRVKPVGKARASSIDGIELDAAAAAGSDGMSREVESKVRLTRSAVEKLKSKVKPGGTKARASSVDDIELAPFSAKSFSELGLPPLLIERLESEGFKVPTDVQSAAIPTLLNDHDVVIQSYTGSGKTLAYLLPILSKIGPLKSASSASSDDGGGGKRRNDIEAVVVAPSRELGMQIVREVENILGPENKRAVQQLVGGANRSRQEEALKKNKPAIVVGTPGRIAEISAAGKLHTHGCRFLVLDEVDELLSFNFREAMRRILDHVGRKSERRTVLVSATVPFAVIRAARSWSSDPVLVQAKKVTPLESVPPPGPVDATLPASESNPSASQSLPPSLKHYYTVVKLQHKVDALRRCVHAMDAKCVIAFMNHTKQLKDVVYKLEARGMSAAELHGDLGKLGRSTIMKRFKNGELRVLVTNELSARGLDVPECDLVVNLDLPTDSVHYAHRAGRTGRLGRKGTVVTICEDSQAFVVRKMEKQLGVAIRGCEFTEGKFVTDCEDKEARMVEPVSGSSEMVQQQACST